MKKLLSGVLTLGLCFTLIGCGKKNSKSTTKEKTTYDIDTNNPNYESNYSPILSDTLPRIDINVADDSLSHEEKMKFVTEPNRDNPPADYTECNVTVSEGSDISIDGKKAGVKVRGNWTTYYDKKPLRIKFDKKQSMLGLNNGEKYKSWVLLAAYKDWSILRDASAFYLAKLMGAYYASDFRLVNVYINGEYWGVYLLVEQQQTGSTRVNITEPEKLDDGTYYTGTDIGYFLEYDGYYTEEDPNQTFTVEYKGLPNYDKTKAFPKNKFQKGFTIKSDIYSENQRLFIKNYMQNVFDISYNAIVKKEFYEFDSTYSTITKNDSLNSYTAISKVIDVDSLVNAYILAEITCDVDIAWSSMFMDVDFGENGSKKLVFEAPWDYDSSLGNTRGCPDAKGIFAADVEINAMNEESANPWYLLFYQCDWFRDLVKDKLNGMKDKKVFEKVVSFITDASTKYEEDFKNNYTKWNNCGHPETINYETNENSAKCKTEKEAANWLKEWFTMRVENVIKIFNEQ